MSIPMMNDRVDTILKQLGTECPLEEVMDLCPNSTWNQIFLAIDDLSRRGQIRVRLDANRTYWVQSYHQEADVCSPTSPVAHV